MLQPDVFSWADFLYVLFDLSAPFPTQFDLNASFPVLFHLSAGISVLKGQQSLSVCVVDVDTALRSVPILWTK